MRELQGELEEYLKDVYSEGLQEDLKLQIECAFIMGAAAMMNCTNQAAARAELVMWTSRYKQMLPALEVMTMVAGGHA